jgi:hypothetical protein
LVGDSADPDEERNRQNVDQRSHLEMPYCDIALMRRLRGEGIFTDSAGYARFIESDDSGIYGVLECKFQHRCRVDPLSKVAICPKCVVPISSISFGW